MRLRILHQTFCSTKQQTVEPTEVVAMTWKFCRVGRVAGRVSTATMREEAGGGGGRGAGKEGGAAAPLLPSSPAPLLPSPSARVDDEFGDLDNLLKETDTLAVDTSTKVAEQAAARETEVPTSCRQLPRRAPLEQMMRVPVKLDNVSNLVGELVVYRNTLEQDQERLRQFLDNLLHQVQQLGNLSSRMQELYEQSLLEIANK